MEDLKKVLLSKPSIEVVYLNDKEEWQFIKRPGFDTILTREDVLGTASEDASKGKKKESKAKE